MDSFDLIDPDLSVCYLLFDGHLFTIFDRERAGKVKDSQMQDDTLILWCHR